jgi:branched-chain amino acid transport system substrate-binding protein
MTQAQRCLRVVILACSIVACSRSQPSVAESTSVSPATATADIKTIKLGQTMPYSGAASAYSTIGKLHTQYFKQLNDAGGVRGRKIELLSLDDAYSPPKTLEQVRQLVEQEHVLAVYQSVGTAANSAVHKYLNAQHVPQLFASTGATKWADPEHYPWTIGFNPSYQREGRTYAEHILKYAPKAKIAVLYQNDDFGKDLLKGLRDGLGSHADMIVSEVSYETSDAKVDSQITTLKASKADTFIDIATPKFAAQAVRAAYDTGWKPTHYLCNVGSSVGTVLVPAGVEKALGLYTTVYIKDPNDKQWDNDPAMQKYKRFMHEHFPDGDVTDSFNAYAYVSAQVLVQVLTQCGDEITRENIIKQAANLKDYAPELLRPGVTINTSPTDFELFDRIQLAKFDGQTWVATDG